MLHRFIVILIVLFWASMTSLLVVRELYPGITRLNQVRPGHVTQLIFQHQQASDLQIHDGQTEVGFVHLQPVKNAKTGAQAIEAHGNLSINLPGGGRQRFSWVGAIEFDAIYQLQGIRLNLAFQQAGGQIEIQIDPNKKLARYTVKGGGSTSETAEFSLDDKGFAKLFGRMGLSAVPLPALQGGKPQISPPEFLTQTSSLQLNGETISTYLFTMKVEGQMIIEAHLSQLGHVLRAQIPLLGYKFAPQHL